MRFKKLDLNLLVALDHLVTLKSVSLAAEKMFMSQSAMSNALNRLRQYFDDPLLVQVGKRMEVTPRAEAMHPAIREILVRIEATIDTSPEFDPTQSSRAFNVLVSDYSLRVLIPRVLAEMEQQGARVRINLLTQSSTPHTMLERGDADLLISPDIFISPDHPAQCLFEDTYVVIACAKGPHADGVMDLARYGSARHAVMVPPNTSGMSIPVEEHYLRDLGIARQVELTTFSFSSLPHLVAGTSCIATVHGMLADLSRASAGIVTFPMPFEMPRFRQMVQWHSYRDQDPGILWIRDLFLRAGAALQTH
ncbi:MAG: LysR family transcriptional regulator [Rhodobacteraceae bacterium]|nr:LysR family transcriptional regulator [Paracoccaceae bacterium]